MWIFGYGSLVWKVDFPFSQKVVGYIKGYDRRFWQASIDHRGVPEKPGRVVTLVPSQDPEARVWGIAYEIEDRDTDTIASINHRERRFVQISLPFFPNPTDRQLTTTTTSDDVGLVHESFPVSVYVGPEKGPLFLGAASIGDIAVQVSTSSGPSGPNAEYVFLLAQFMREQVPGVIDEHLFGIETELLTIQEKKNSRVKVWGAAYKIHDSDIPTVLQHLDHREVMGYEKVPVAFYPKTNEPTIIITPSSFTVTMYYGSSDNEHYLGPAPLEVMSRQIYESSGPSGRNKDYLYNLTQALRDLGQEDALDSHLTELESAVRALEEETSYK